MDQMERAIKKERTPGSWVRNSGDLRAALAREVPAEVLTKLHRMRPWRHFATAGRQVGLMLLLGWACFYFKKPAIWVPLAILQGFVLFDFTVLLHEVLHHLVWPRGKTGARPYALLGWLYALPSGISPSQFTRWHLDHHAGLGSDTEDPKRHRLSPRLNARWLKALYFTPALFLIYFTAAAKETATYPPGLRRKIARERAISLLVHLSVATSMALMLGWPAMIRVYLFPYLFGFPIAFGLNRLGQHYDIDPDDPARWGTRMRSSLFWDIVFLNSGHHLEHHYFPGVPFYNLRALNRALGPFFEKRPIPARSYSWLLWQYIGLNKKPHSNWG